MASTPNVQPPPGYHLVICRSICRNGKTIYPKNGEYFAFYAKDK